MKLRRSIVVGVVTLSCAVVLAADNGAKSEDNTWMKGMKANSVDAIMACYAPNAIGWFPGEVEAKGEKAIRDSYVKTFAEYEVKDVNLSETTYKDAGKLSLGWGKATISVVAKATGKSEVWKARYTDVAERRGERWVYIVDHASAEPAAAESPKKD
jgi:ketosteroid isomerase-like protein